MISFTRLFELEDRFVRMPGLYLLWTSFFIANMAVLCTDSTVGNSRDFNALLSIGSTLFVAFSSYNTVYGNKLPSTMMLVVGPLYLYSYWALLAYFRGDVFGDHNLGRLNGAHTVLAGMFSLDMVVKTWFVTLFPQKYEKYCKADDLVPSNEVVVQT
tara:strand:+ start:1336 stop:1806 length:471 start_codon:yes stop_codon:yes gene_type:complete